MQPSHAEVGKKRIAIFVQSLAARGGEKFSIDLAHALAEQGHDVDVVAHNATGPLRAQISATVRVVDLKAPRIIATLPRFRQYLIESAPDTVLAIDEYSHLIAITAAVFLAKPPRIVLRIGTKFSELFERHTGLKDRYLIPLLVRLLYRFADQIVAVSKGIADDISCLTGIAHERITVIYNPKDGNGIRARMQEPVDHAWFGATGIPVLVGIGRITTQKHLDLLVRAFAHVHSQTSARLIILGDGNSSLLMALAAQKGCADAVDFIGHVDNPYAYLARADTFVLSSLWEGMPNALLEAMFCGIPAISTDCPYGPREILAPDTSHRNLLTAGFEKAEYGILCTTDDEDALAAGILELLADKKLQEEYCAKSMERAQDFSMECLLPRYESILNLL